MMILKSNLKKSLQINRFRSQQAANQQMSIVITQLKALSKITKLGFRTITLQQRSQSKLVIARSQRETCRVIEIESKSRIKDKETARCGDARSFRSDTMIDLENHSCQARIWKRKKIHSRELSCYRVVLRYLYRNDESN